MRVLVVSPTPSHPQDAGNRRRIHALLRALKGFGHRVHLVLLQRESVGEAAIEAMRRDWDEVTLVPHDRRQERPSLGAAGFALDDWIQPPLEAALSAIAAAPEPPDVVIAEYVFLSRALDFFPDERVVKVLDTHDVFANRHARLAALGLAPGFFSTTPEEEARGLDRADLVLAIQDEERRELEERASRAVVATLGFLPPEAPEAAPLPAPEAWPAEEAPAGDIGYLASINPMNERALRRFVEALDLPAIGAGGRRLVIGGAVAARFLSAPPPIDPIGPVPDAAAFLAEIDLVVNPHEGGTGLKIKTVEALAHGRPVIGTAEAFAGLPATEAFHAARSAAEVARMAVRYVLDAGFRAHVRRESAALRARYAAEVRAQTAIFRSAATLRAALRRPRALLVTDIPFWNETVGNRARIAELVRTARGAMDVDAFLLPGAAPATAEEGARLRGVLGGRGKVFLSSAIPGAAAASPTAQSAALTPYERRSVQTAALAALEAHLAARPYNLAIVEYIRLSWARHARGMPPLTALDTHDLMAARVENFAAFGEQHFIRIDALEELRILDGFGAVLAIQPEEARWLDAALPGGRVLHVPHALPAPARAELSAPAAAGRPRRVVFVGGDSPMNRDGLAWLIDQVWPCVARRGAELHIAGGICSKLPPPGRRPPGIVAHGLVADLAGFLLSADLAVNPVFYGGGLKIKTVEYLCHGLPSVLTEEAAYGLPREEEGSAYAIARSRADFIELLEMLLGDDPAAAARRTAMGEAAFSLGRRAYGTRAAAAPLVALAELARPIATLRAQGG